MMSKVGKKNYQKNYAKFGTQKVDVLSEVLETC